MGTRAASGIAKFEMGGTITNLLDADGTGTASVGVKQTVSQEFSTGTGVGQADRIWQDNGRSLNQSASEDLDLYDLAAFDTGAGAGNDALGQAWVVAEISGIMVQNASTSTGSLIIGGDGAATAFNTLFNGADDGQIGPIPPGGMFSVYYPTNPSMVVADSTNHLLTFTESGVGALTYNVTIIGRSA